MAMMRSREHRANAGRPRPVRLASLAALLVGLVALSLLAASCGGSSKTPVAHVSSTTTSASDSGSSNGSSSGKGDPTKYAACMRKHGVPNFPDPDSNGRFKITGGVNKNGQHFGLDPNSPQYKAAQQACQKLAPNGGKPNPQEEAKLLQQSLRYAACMRSHGVPNFPDPKRGPGGEGTLLTIGPDVNPNSPMFKAAQKACQKLVPGSAFEAGPSTAP
jgi:hypothetical protein